MQAARPGEAPNQAPNPLESPTGDGAPGELRRLRVENARLIALLDAHGIAWQAPLTANEAQPPADTMPAQSDPSPQQSTLMLQSALPTRWAAPCHRQHRSNKPPPLNRQSP